MHSRRGLLYMPGDNWKMITKSITLGVDCICMDMEDGTILIELERTAMLLKKG